MSQSIKTQSTLNPIETILESLSISGKSNNSTSTSINGDTKFTAPSLPTRESITSSLGFKIIVILFFLLIGIVGYTYLEKEVNGWIANIKNYFETKKYTKKEEERQKEIEKEKTSDEQTTEYVIKDAQDSIDKNKNGKNNKNKNDKNGKNKNKNDKNQEPVNYTASSKLNSSAFEKESNVEEYSKDALQKALDDSAQSGGEVIPDSSESRIQSGKSGWCLIGTDNSARSCAEVGVNDVCMSGDIYPRKDVCINPSLRA